jgi:tetratricopeptide (TPR) repeat protein
MFSGASWSAPALAAVLLAAGALAVGGCAQVGQIQAKKDAKAANQAYQAQDYKKAVELYESAVKADPNLGYAYFFLGNSYDNLWKPSKKGDPQNDELMNKAVANYQLAAEKLMSSDNPEFKKYGTLALQYLVAAYGADKLNDPAKAEPVVQKMIQLEPGEPTNYFALAKIYEDAGVYDEAEKVYLQAKDARPNDPSVYTTLAAYYNRQGQFDKTIDALEQRAAKEPNNPEAFHTIASYYWDEATRDARLKDAEKRAYVQKGIVAADRALQLKGDYVEAMVFKGLLLRLQATLEKDPSKQQALLKQASDLHDKAEDVRKKKAAGIGD